MDNPTTTISQNIINVDIDSRAVTLPVNFNLGVMYDNSCKTITFMVQQKSDITDLTDLTFSVNTVSARGTPDKLECDTREEGGFYIITAVLKGTIFEASGKAVFNLCGQKFDSSHVAVKSWGSEDITALVGSHYHADKAIEELYPNVLEELRQKVNNPNLTDAQINTIATKVAEKGIGLSTEAIDKLEEVGNYLAYTTADGGSKWTELISILRNGSSGGGSGETEVTLSSISATYTGEEVTTGTALSDLTGITVIATYSDGTTKTVTGYTLSGEILEGENIITVSYGGKTTTFTVTGIVESGGGEVTAKLPTDGLVSYFDLRNRPATTTEHTDAYSLDATQGNGMLYAWHSSQPGNEYGMPLKTSSYSETTDSNTQKDFGTEFTWAMYGYNTAFYPTDYGSLSNVALIIFKAQGNKSSGGTTTFETLPNVGTRPNNDYHSIIITVSTETLKLFYNGTLLDTFVGSDYDDFASWLSKSTFKRRNDSGYATALALYERALSEVEITEINEYFKTLEVA